MSKMRGSIYFALLIAYSFQATTHGFYAESGWINRIPHVHSPCSILGKKRLLSIPSAHNRNEWSSLNGEALSSGKNTNVECDSHGNVSSVISGGISVYLLFVCLNFVSPFRLSADAFENSDFASTTVVEVVENLKASSGNTLQTFGILQSIADIITEGKGVGGRVDYAGVQLQRGLVADEDTAIYNPGLTLLTESEKERLVAALFSNRKANIELNTWSEDNESGYTFLKDKLDPLHMFELATYLRVLPLLGGVIYLISLFIQQNYRPFFPAAYIIGASAVFGPMFAILLLNA